MMMIMMMMKIMMKIMKIAKIVKIKATTRNLNFQVQSFKIQERRPHGGEEGGAHQVSDYTAD